ncbi:MAG TPA: LacI family DNA-binding transcriptional regulator [Anaerolineaceae bacterium]|nr:LacI family DNA-binding transcriptional regulator [Anaerolineaceae bacterium]
MPRPTLRDVAALAGVSHQTVSRVINNNEAVLPDTRERVMQAIHKLGYLPNAIARSMAQGRTCTLACLAPNLTDFTFASNIQGAESAARARNYFVLSASAETVEEYNTLLDELIGHRRVDGVILINPYLESREFTLPANIPLVYLGGRENTRAHCVYLDNRDGAYQAARHLLDYRHRLIGQVSGPAAEDCTQERSLGFEMALREAGIEPDPLYTYEGDWSATSGYQALRYFLQRKPAPSAIVAQNDRMAVGVIRAARDAGLRVPEDISVIGFDDMPLASYFDPPLTSMRQDTFQFGAAAAGMLIDILENPGNPRQVLRFPASLVVRKSTALRKGS